MQANRDVLCIGSKLKANPILLSPYVFFSFFSQCGGCSVCRWLQWFIHTKNEEVSPTDIEALCTFFFTAQDGYTRTAHRMVHNSLNVM
jgi:hypothetical protein